MENRPWERSVQGWEAGATLPHPFFVSTEKQRSRDFPGLPNLEPGEGELGPGLRRSKEALGLGQGGNAVYVSGGS